MGFCSDTCNVMFGANHSVSTLLKEELPCILAVKCSCHSIHLVASKACRMLPEELEITVRDIVNTFSKSSARRREFVAFQEFANIAKHVMLSPGQTRWLSLEASVLRILEQLPALILYFDAESLDEKMKDAANIASRLRDPRTKPFLLFLKYALGMFNEFNTVFQSEKPLLYELKNRVFSLIKNFASNFMHSRYVRSTYPTRIDPTLSNQYLPLHQIYLGNNSRTVKVPLVMQSTLFLIYRSGEY